MFNKKYMIVFLALLIAFMSVAVAADVNNQVADSTDITDDDPTSISDEQQQTAVSENNIITKESKTIKTDEEYTGITVNQNNFDDYFDTDGSTKSTVSNNSNLRFDGTIYVEQDIIIDKTLNITAINNGKIYLNTIAGSLMVMILVIHLQLTMQVQIQILPDLNFIILNYLSKVLKM